MKLTRTIIYAKKREQAAKERLLIMRYLNYKRRTSFYTALIVSIVSLFLSLVVFSATTYAWFSNSVINSNNKIQSGVLDVDYVWKKAGAETIFVASEDKEVKLFKSSSWGPGSEDLATIRVKNQGSIDINYSLYIEVKEGYSTLGEGGGKLEDVLDVWVNDVNIGKLKDFLSSGDSRSDSLFDGELLSGATSDEIKIKITMPLNAESIYQNASIKFDIKLYATQSIVSES